jgi:hypothetical protein
VGGNVGGGELGRIVGNGVERRVGDVVGEGDGGFVGLEVGDNIVGERGVSSATGWDVGW